VPFCQRPSAALCAVLIRSRACARTLADDPLCSPSHDPPSSYSREASFAEGDSVEGEGSADESSAAIKRQIVIDYPKHFPKGKPSTVTTINPKLMREAGGY
jgi:hypothetical protein